MDYFQQFFESLGFRDLIEIAILTVILWAGLSFIGNVRGIGAVRSLAVALALLFLLAQVIIVSFDLTELSQTLDYFLLTLFLGLLVILQPELRRGFFTLGHSRLLWGLRPPKEPVADELTRAARHLSETRTGALIVIQREVPLDPFTETGTALDSKVSAELLVALFYKNGPLHDGAVILREGRVAAAGCQLPLVETEASVSKYGMRHRAALGITEETDAEVVVVSEETGNISLGRGGQLEPVSVDELSRQLRRLALVDTGPLGS
jgi:diadenylate cyclase